MLRDASQQALRCSSARGRTKAAAKCDSPAHKGGEQAAANGTAVRQLHRNALLDRPEATKDEAAARCLRALPREPRLAGPRRRHRHAVAGIFVELVAQRADRDAEDVGGVGAVAETVLERLQNEIALDVGDGAADQRARDRLGGKRRMRDRRRVGGQITGTLYSLPL